ncbi:MAG: DUF4097 domain-containing protein [Gammaproteobacteria bacterium]|nr:DUF4097 domain-containing protein [Gammaproteobacteria bacterium]MBM4229810.1 DUF4097 domain-containing protein [Gammaproteobacteria bacterium]
MSAARPLFVAVGLITLALSTTVAAADEVTRTRSFKAAEIASVALRSGVGEVRIEQGTGDVLEAQVTIKPKRTTGIFSALPDVKNLDMSATTRGDQLSLEVDAKNIEERWLLRLPKKMLSAVEVKLGVGDIKATASAKRIEVDVGVGDADIDIAVGAITLQVGTGDASIRTPRVNAGTIDGKTGVGGVSLKGLDGTVKGSTVGGSVSGQGAGQQPIEARVGVGDLNIVLSD